MTRGHERGDEQTGPEDDSVGPSTGRTRRDLLRRGAVSLGVGTTVIGTAPGTALATRCPRPAAYWRSHPDEWPSFADGACFLLLDGQGRTLDVHPNDDRSRVLGDLTTPPRGDRYLQLVRQYVAALLNRRYVGNYPPTYGHFWDWVRRYVRWVRSADRPQRKWAVDGVNGAVVAAYFRRWNRGVGWGCTGEYPPTTEYGQS